MAWRIFDRYGTAMPSNPFAYHQHNEAQADKRILGYWARARRSPGAVSGPGVA